jgi:hypothetical protein
MEQKKFLLALSALLFLCGTAFSQDMNDFIYIQNRSGGITIVGYTGANKDVAVPSSIGGAPVTAIGNRAFHNKGLTSVNLPESVETIGVQAFAQNSIVTLVLPDGVRIIETGAFSANNMESVTIPDSVTVIRYNAFGGNPLEDVRISRNVRAINPRVFVRSSPNHIVIGENVDIYQGNFDQSFVNSYDSRDRQQGDYVRRDGVWVFAK